ncbi:hypothetical protein DRN98_09805 [Methanosarcinales archaeon]|nr:MAG: hypothetical protein DRN98_09805 [Methanosarcinales archaeon]
MINEVIEGDCLEVLDNFLDARIQFDLIVADPPFNQGKNYGTKVNDSLPLDKYYMWCESWMKKCFAVLAPHGSFYVYSPSKHLGLFQVTMQKYGIWQNTIVWGYTNPTPDRKRFPKSWSAFLFFTKTDAYYFNPEAKRVEGFRTNPSSEVRPTRLSDLWLNVSKLVGGFLAQKEVILKPGTKSRACIYQLPEELLERIILSSSKEGDLVLDLFAHSGTASVVAKKLSRHSIAVEIESKYCEIIKTRLGEI